MASHRSIIVIPARMASQRLPDKPLADIGGEAMIVHVMRRAEEANLGPVVVACAETEIAEVVTQAGGTAILTDPNHASGSDRIFEALNKVDPAGEYDSVINLQGDLPLIDPQAIQAALAPLQDPQVDIATLGCVITDEPEKTDPNVVKIILSMGESAVSGRALYFTRAPAPTGDGDMWHHIGIYAYRRAALAKFVELPPSPLEMRERLEQLRALEAGMRVDVALVDTVPFGVDTSADLARARAMYAARS